MENIGVVIAELMETRTCIRCGSLYSEMDEAGRWSCRVHPDVFQGWDNPEPGTELETFRCCGVSGNPRSNQWKGPRAARGCTPCDHTIRRGVPVTLRLPVDRAEILFGSRLREGRPGFRVLPSHVDIVRYADQK